MSLVRVRLAFWSLLFGGALGASPWVMFSDSQDTYLYNQKTGEVYIRYRQGGKNYEDRFVKMPQGLDLTRSETSLVAPLEPTKEERQKLLERAQELQRGLYNQPLE